jgi:hypothetical protein
MRIEELTNLKKDSVTSMKVWERSSENFQFLLNFKGSIASTRYLSFFYKFFLSPLKLIAMFSEKAGKLENIIASRELFSHAFPHC